jgi:hypothetical protein
LRLEVHAGSWDNDGVGLGQRLGAMSDGDGEVGVRTYFPGPECAGHHLIERGTRGRARLAEEAMDDAELK